MNCPRSLVVAASVVGLVLGAFAQEKSGSTVIREAQPEVSERTPQAGMIYRPESGKVQTPGFARTTYVLPSADGNKPAAMAAPTMKAAPNTISPEGVVLTEVAETPQSLGCLYVASPSSTGCIPNYNSGSGGPSANGYGAIALVDAFDNPDAASDLQTFDSYWGLAPATFVKVYANGNGDCTTPAANAGWSVESSMDIEYAHVFAPNAVIILVEACSNSFTDLLYAEQVAFNYIVSNYPAGGQVSNSWLGGEFSGQVADDSFFADFNYNWSNGYKTPILAFASAGDGGAGAAYPSNNPWVISAGGTSIMRNSSTLKFSSEACWGGSGGGVSSIESFATSFNGGHSGPWANFQYPIFGQANRATPDMSFDADPASGAWVYSAFGLGGWSPVGGTSLSSPALASIVNRMGNKLGSVFITPATSGADWFATWEHNYIYSQLATSKAYKADFYDVTTGSNGNKAVASWDMCTGVGSPRGSGGK
jgi:subtilase family serine protease